MWLSRLRYAPVTLCAAFLLRQSPIMAQSDVQTVLDQVTSAVRARYLGGYLVSIDRHKRAAPHYGGALGGSGFDDGPLAPNIPFGDDGAHDVITLARLGHYVRYDVRNSGGDRWQLLTDGNTLWTYRQDIGLYTEEPAEPWPQRLGPGPGLPGIEWHYFAKFLALSGMADNTRLISDDLAPTAACPGPSALLEISLPDGKEELRVLSKSHLPCQSKTLRNGSSAHGIHSDVDETIVWRFAPDRPAASFFVFAPHKGARRVKRIPLVY